MPARIVDGGPPSQLAQVAEIGFSHRLTAYKIVGHFFGLSYRKISLNNQVENSKYINPRPRRGQFDYITDIGAANLKTAANSMEQLYLNKHDTLKQ